MFDFPLPFSRCYLNAKEAAEDFKRYWMLPEADKNELVNCLISAIQRAAWEIPYPPMPLATFGQAQSRAIAMTTLFDAIVEKAPEAVHVGSLKKSFTDAATELQKVPGELIKIYTTDLEKRRDMITP